MGLKQFEDEGSYVALEKGANALIKISDIEISTGSYDGDEYEQIKFEFDAVAENGEDQGEIPGWFTSKITITDSEETTSSLGVMLKTTDTLEDVLTDIFEEDEDIDDVGSAVDSVKNGDARWEADSFEENQLLGKAIANHLRGVVMRAGTTLSGNEEYSRVKEVYGRSDSDPFSEGEDGEVIFDEDDDEEDSENDGDDEKESIF